MSELVRYRDVAQPTLDIVKRLLAYWQSKCREDRLPARADIDPTEMIYILPCVSMLDVLPTDNARQRFRFRLFGTSLVRFHDKDFTGRFYHDVFDEKTADNTVRYFDRIVTTRKPAFVTGRTFFVPGRQWSRFESCHMPLENAEGRVNIILGATVYSDI